MSALGWPSGAVGVGAYGVADRLTIVWAGADGGPLAVAHDRSAQALKGRWPHRRRRLCWVVPSGWCSVLQVERPAVADAELAEALRWPAAEALGARPDEIVVDVLGEPLDGRVMAAVGHISQLAPTVAALRAARIDLVGITTPEAALALAAERQWGDESVVIVDVSGDADGVGIVVCRAGQVRLVRAQAQGHLTHGAGGDAVAVEVQRSVDYYGSRFRDAAVRTVALVGLPEDEEGERCRAALAEATGLSVQRLAPPGLGTCTRASLAALGGALWCAARSAERGRLARAA